MQVTQPGTEPTQQPSPAVEGRPHPGARRAPLMETAVHLADTPRARPEAAGALTAPVALHRAEQTISAAGELLTPLAREFEAAGYQLFLVGGPVRDALLGRPVHDYDFTTDAHPDAVQDILGRLCTAVWDTGIDYGTISGERDGQQFEITTFRADTYDRVSRNPQVQFGDTLDDDLIRRDFRCNAIAVGLHGDGSLDFHDPLGGLEDVLRGRLDTPATPEESFGDDPLRMLRAARFESQLGFAVAPRVEAAMAEMADQISRITAERVHAELDKLMLGAAPWDGMDLLVNTGLAGYVFPEIPQLRLAPDEHLQHKDVYAHSMTVLKQAMDQEQDGPDLVLRWAALLHDVGKPDTRAAKPGGGVTFYQHEVVGAKLVRRRLRELKYSKQMVKDISQLVYLHMRFHGYSDGQWTDSAVRRYVTDAGELLPRLNKLVRADCTTRNRKKAARLGRACDSLEERIEQLAKQEDLAKVRPAVDGNRIMEILGLKPGKEVGQAWAFLKDLRLERGPMEPEEAEAELLRWWAQRDPRQPGADAAR